MTVETVQEYINTIDQLKDSYTYEESNGFPHILEQKQTHTPRFIYRGHNNHRDYQLIPGIFRWKKTHDGHDIGEYSQLEFNILSDFISESCRYIKDAPVDDIAAWLEIAQHFGVPTRLLDFTQNPLAALYFACSQLTETTASVWILNEASYNKKYFGSPLLPAKHYKQLVNGIVRHEIISCDCPSDDRPQRTQNPVIYQPAYREERMAMQSSVFLLWAAQRIPLTDIISSDYRIVFDNVQNAPKGILGNIEIPGDAKTRILAQLNELGINEKFIYPGLDGVGKYIKTKYSSRTI